MTRNVPRTLTLAFGVLALASACGPSDAPVPPPTPEMPAATPAPADAGAPGPSAGVAYVSNQEGAITVIDLATLQTVGEIATGASSPRGIAVSEDGRLLITANRDQGNVSLIDRATGQLQRQVPIGENPEFVRVRGGFAFVSFEPASEGGPPPKPGSPEAIAAEQAKKARAAGHDDDEEEPAQIAVVDLAKGEVVRRITGGLETEGIEFSADGLHILITNEADDTITVHEIASGRQVKRIDTAPHGPRPRGIKRAPDGQSYVATLEHGNKLLVLDAAFEPVRTVPTGNVPYGVTFDRKGERLYVALAHGKALQVFDGKTLAPIKEVPTGARCWHFSFTPDDARILVACGRSHEIVVIDAATLTEVKRIEDKKLPWGIVTWPKSVGSLDWPT
jgi:YVTN family beta-propeller protein